jgi:hypothetical protein
MPVSIALILCLIFIALAIWHFHMAVARKTSVSGAVPSVEGKPLFVPSRLATMLVGLGLLLCAGLVAGTGGLVKVSIPALVFSWSSYVLAIGLAARAIGDFRYVGFFKRVRNSRFATLDTLLYSPLCLALAIGVAFVARNNSA